jgi:peroxiredoxin
LDARSKSARFGGDSYTHEQLDIPDVRMGLVRGIAMALNARVTAPDFTLFETPERQMCLSDLGTPVVLIFYPADWSPVCSDELSVFSAANKLFQAHGAQLLGISVDSKWSHQAFKADHQLGFPLLADFHPKGDTARAYGVYRHDDGISERALFVIDADRCVAWSQVSPLDVSPGADGALRAVEALQ